MSIQYDRYLTQHIKNVGKGLAWLRTNLPDILREGEFPEVNYDLQFQQHDASKYDKEEYDAYDAYFYGPTRSYKVVQNFNRAWLHHIHHNPHHWQHWVLLEDDPSGGNVCIEMPHCYVVEMICDWWAFSWAKDDLTEIFSWWDKHKDIVQLHKNTRKTVLDILERIRAKLEEDSEDSLAHHGIKGQKWGVRRTPEELNAARGLASEGKSDTIIKDAIESGEVSKTINMQKQVRHTQKEHIPGRSYIYGDINDAQKLVDKLSGTGVPLVTDDGKWLHKEKVSSSKTIGMYVDENGVEMETAHAMIVYSKTGAHVYPRKENK